MALLNDLLNEFSPPSGEIPTGFNYVQIVDCSVALYNLLQKHTVCPHGDKVESGPFCAPYHMQTGAASQQQGTQPMQGVDEVQDVADAQMMQQEKGLPDESGSSVAAQSSYRSSMYFFLQNTMQEFPFAWWYKCVLLQSRTISADDKAIHCDTWMENSISEKSMAERFGLYSENDVRSTLKQVNGGITSVVLGQAIASLAETLAEALQNFTTSGFQTEAEMQQRDAELARSDENMDSERRMLRIGAPREYNMKCYSRSFLPNSLPELLGMGDKSGIDCITNMLMWIHNEGANFTRYDCTCSSLLILDSFVVKHAHEHAHTNMHTRTHKHAHTFCRCLTALRFVDTHVLQIH
jgi:hypothetical protein